jgi:hypothetical protein
MIKASITDQRTKLATTTANIIALSHSRSLEPFEVFSLFIKITFTCTQRHGFSLYSAFLSAQAGKGLRVALGNRARDNVCL